MHRLAPVLLVVFALLAALAPVARGYELDGSPWPKRTITYANAAPGWSAAVSAAARTWNSAGAQVRFRRASRARADVLVRLAPRSRLRGCSGIAQVGYAPAIRQASVWLSRGCDYRNGVLVATHEFGHILGLGHYDRRCAVMNSYGIDGIPFRCTGTAGASEDELLRADDLRGLSRLYPLDAVLDAPADPPLVG